MTTAPPTVRSVLVADDDDRLREAIRDYAASAGFETWEATNGLEALWIVKHHRPNVVLLDLVMPRLDGFQAAQHIRKFDSSIRIVIVTGNRSEATRRRVLALGYALVVKPFDLGALDAALGTSVP